MFPLCLTVCGFACALERFTAEVSSIWLLFKEGRWDDLPGRSSGFIKSVIELEYDGWVTTEVFLYHADWFLPFTFDRRAWMATKGTWRWVSAAKWGSSASWHDWASVRRHIVLQASEAQFTQQRFSWKHSLFSWVLKKVLSFMNDPNSHRSTKMIKLQGVRQDCRRP